MNPIPLIECPWVTIGAGTRAHYACTCMWRQYFTFTFILIPFSPFLPHLHHSPHPDYA